MSQEYYLIKEAAAKVGVESHVLRYWEEELKMDIHRNAMGHRYYTDKDIEVLSNVKELKKKGLQLRAVRDYLEKRRQQIAKGGADSGTDVIHVVAEAAPEKSVVEARGAEPGDKQEAIVPVKRRTIAGSSNEEKMEQFQQIMTRVLANAIKENNDLIGKSAGEHAANAVVNQIQGMTKEQEERAEERYRKLDQTLREIQRARAEAAVSIHSMDKRKQKRMKRKAVQARHPSEAAENTSDGQEESAKKEEA